MTNTNIRWSYFWFRGGCGTEVLYDSDGIPSCTRFGYELDNIAAVCHALATLPRSCMV